MMVKYLLFSFFFIYFASKFGVLCPNAPDFLLFLYVFLRNS